MDNLTAKEFLTAYRPNGADASDPIFREALEQCKHDPSLESWLNDQKAFDARMSAELNNLHAPESAKEALHATLGLNNPPSCWRRVSRLVMPLAAALIMGVGLMLYHTRKPDLIWEPGALAVSSLSRDSRPLDFQAADSVTMTEWLAARGAPVPSSLPVLLQEAVGKGCKLFDDGQGNTISMLCFSIGNHMVHLFVFDENTRHYVNLSSERWKTERGWNLRMLPQGGRLLAVATRGNTDALDSLW